MVIKIRIASFSGIKSGLFALIAIFWLIEDHIDI